MTTFSYSSGNPANLVGGATATMADISGPFTDLTTFLNGSIDTTNLATSAKPATLLGQYRTVTEAFSGYSPSDTSGTYVFCWATAALQKSPAGVTAATAAATYLDPSDYSVSGLTAKLRVRGVVFTNGTAPGITFTFGLYPITTGGGANALVLTTGTVVASSTAAVVTPSLNSVSTAVSSDISVPSAGAYALAVAFSGTTAASSVGLAHARLEVRHV